MAARTEAGTLEQFIYDGIPGTATSNLTQHASFPTQPDLVLPFNLFTEVVESAPGGQNYGSWTRGWLQPPQTGHYTFWLAADDSAELWLSTNAATYPGSSPMHRVAQVLAPTARGEYDRYLTQKSTALWLERGQEYAFSIQHKQGEGDGFFQLGWQLPDGTIQRPLPLQFVQPFVPQAYSGSGVHGLATTPPEIHTFFSGTRFDVVTGQPVMIAPGVEARPPVSYQWYRNGVPLDGETLPWLEWLPNYSQDYSAKFTLVAASPTGFAISPDFQFNFVADPMTFHALRAETLGNPAGFNVTFSRPLRPDTATNTANYRVDHGVTVLGAEWQHGTNTQVVVVQTTPLQPDVQHRVTFHGIVAANESPLPFGSQLVIRRGDGGIGVKTDIPPGPVLPLPCIGCPPTASTNLLTSLETSVLRDGNRTVNARGYLTPVETADYVFHLSASGITYLHLSGDESPANKRLIALEPEWHLARSWTSADRRARMNSGSPLIATYFPEVDPELPVNQSAYTIGAIRLEAGRRYYLEAEMPGGGGFNQLAVLMRKATDPLPPDGAAPIPGEQLAWLESDFARAPVAITRQPAGTSTLQGRPVEFDIRASGSPWLKSEWLRNGLPVADADELTLTIPETPLRDQQARYSARVRNAFSEARSAEATLSVIPDHAGPQLTGARGSQRGNDVYLTFNEPIRPDLSVSPANFTVVAADDGSALAVLAVEVWGDELNQRFSEVRLTTTQQRPGRHYTVTAQGQRDLHDNGNNLSTAGFTAWVVAPGFALYERYEGITGYSTTNLTGTPKYPHHPDAIAYLNDWETPHDVGDNYGARLSGLVIPPVNGEYQFYLTASDQAFMYLASESGPASMQHVASAWIWASYREWTPGRSGEREPPQPRPPQRLIGGEPRYLEALFKEESHTDYLVATWRTPGEAVPPNGSASRLTGPAIAAWADPEGAGVELVSQPSQVNAVEGQPISISFQGRGWTWLTNDSILAYQWQRDGANLQFVNQAAWVIPRASLADDGARFRCEFWAPASASLMTDDILLRVLPDTTAPRLLSPYPSVLYGNAEQYWMLRIEFSELMDPATAANIANYRVFIRDTGQEVPVLGAEPWHGTQDVALRIGFVAGPPDFEVHVRQLRDASAAGNVVAPGEAFVPRLQYDVATMPQRLRWNLYGDNRVLQSAGQLGPAAFWTNEPGVQISPTAAEFVLPTGGPDRFYRLKLD